MNGIIKTYSIINYCVNMQSEQILTSVSRLELKIIPKAPLTLNILPNTSEQKGFNDQPPRLTLNILSNISNQKKECARNTRWTYERLIQEAQKIHGDKYNYDRVKPESITSNKA